MADAALISDSAALDIELMAGADTDTGEGDGEDVAESADTGLGDGVVELDDGEAVDAAADERSADEVEAESLDAAWDEGDELVDGVGDA